MIYQWRLVVFFNRKSCLHLPALLESFEEANKNVNSVLINSGKKIAKCYSEINRTQQQMSQCHSLDAWSPHPEHLDQVCSFHSPPLKDYVGGKEPVPESGSTPKRWGRAGTEALEDRQRALWVFYSQLAFMWCQNRALVVSASHSPGIQLSMREDLVVQPEPGCGPGLICIQSVQRCQTVCALKLCEVREVKHRQQRNCWEGKRQQLSGSRGKAMILNGLNPEDKKAGIRRWLLSNIEDHSDPSEKGD